MRDRIGTLLSAHPKVDLVHLVSQSFADQPVSAVYPNFKGILIKYAASWILIRFRRKRYYIHILAHSTSDRIISAYMKKETGLLI